MVFGLRPLALMLDPNRTGLDGILIWSISSLADLEQLTNSPKRLVNLA